MFDVFWPSWSAFKGTFGAALTTQVESEIFDAKVRHFPDSLADATFAHNMPEAVYRQLVAEANKHLPSLYRYLRLRKKASPRIASGPMGSGKSIPIKLLMQEP